MVCARGGDDPSRASSSARARHVLHGRTGLRSPRRGAPDRPARPFLNVTPFGPERPSRNEGFPRPASRPLGPACAARGSRRDGPARFTRPARSASTACPCRVVRGPRPTPRGLLVVFPTPPDRLPRGDPRREPRASQVPGVGAPPLASHEPAPEDLQPAHRFPPATRAAAPGGHPRGAGRGQGEGANRRGSNVRQEVPCGRRGDEAGQRPRYARIRTPGALSLPERIVRADRLGVRKGEDGERDRRSRRTGRGGGGRSSGASPQSGSALQTAQNRGRRVRVLRDLRLRSFVQRRYAVAGPRGGRPTPRESRRDAADFAADFAVARRRRKKRGFNPPGFARRSPVDARGDFIRRRPSRACACLRADRRVCVGGTRRWARG